jgi:excinuclease ABC subunit C
MYLKEKIKNTLKVLPKKPGVYIFKDSKSRIIYVGKAKNLADRVRSYFVSSATVSYVNHPISFFKQKISSVDFIVTDNEVEALVLESNLIKKNRPKYNVYLKDDKSYPYVAITENEKFPRVFVTRNRNLKGARYYGPYTNVKDIKKTLDILRRIFLIRDCKKTRPGKIKNSACLNYHINLCSSPCTGKISEEEYKKNIEYVRLFLKGKDRKIVKDLEKEMQKLSTEKKYEEAAELKDRINSINGIFADQKILFSGEDTWDILAVAGDGEENIAVVSVYSYKIGELAAISNFIVSSAGFQAEDEIISGFIKSYYSEIDNIGSVIYIPSEIDDIESISSWLSEAKGKKILIRIPKKGDKKKISKMAEKNAELYLEKKKFEKGSGYSRVFTELVKLQKLLGLKNVPRRMECFDISNI